MAISILSDFIFEKDELERADIIIVPGSGQSELPREAARLYKKKFAPKILFTGGLNPEIKVFESDFDKKIAIDQGVAPKDIFTESKSSNTKENATEALGVIKKNKLAYKKILLICKTYHARRLKMTFAKVFSKSHLIVVPVKDARNITKENWWKEKKKVERVMKEVEKIGKYYLKGDLSL